MDFRGELSQSEESIVLHAGWLAFLIYTRCAVVVCAGRKNKSCGIAGASGQTAEKKNTTLVASGHMTNPIQKLGCENSVGMFAHV